MSKKELTHKEKLALWRYFYKPIGIRLKDTTPEDFRRAAGTFAGADILLGVAWSELWRELAHPLRGGKK